MTDQKAIPLSTVITTIIWGLAFALIIAAWIFTSAGNCRVAIMVGFTAMLTSAVAATVTIRVFTLRTQSLIRALSGLDGGGLNDADGSVHRLR